MKKVKVVAALIKKDSKYLIARRSTGDVNMIGKWEFPGGKVESDKDELIAIEREIKEEFELDVKAIRFITNNVCEYTDKIVDLSLYECNYIRVYDCGTFRAIGWRYCICSKTLYGLCCRKTGFNF